MINNSCNDTISDVFFHTQNFETLLNVVQTDTKRRLNIDINQECPHVRTILFETMIQVYDDNPNANIQSLNKHVLKSSIPHIMKSLQSREKTEETQDIPRLEPGMDSSLDHLPKNMATPISHLETVDETIIDDAYDNRPQTHNVVKESSSLERDAVIQQIVKNTAPMVQNNPAEKLYKDTVLSLEINSRDRLDYSAMQDSAYKFSVKLGGMGSQSVISFVDGVRTTTQYASQSGIAITEYVKNCVKLSLSHIIIPNINNNIARFPYLYVEVLEVPGQFLATSNHARRAFAKVIRDKDWIETSSSNLAFFCMYDKFSHGWQSETPIASLSKLSIEIRSPRGELIQTYKDTYEVSSFEYDTNEVIIVTLASYFTTNNFNTEQTITFHDVTFDSSTTDLIDFFTRDQGHIISSLDTESKQITISCPSTFDETTGDTIYESFDLTAGDTVTVTNGYVVNSSMQTSACFHCTTRQYKHVNDVQIV